MIDGFMQRLGEMCEKTRNRKLQNVDGEGGKREGISVGERSMKDSDEVH